VFRKSAEKKHLIEVRGPAGCVVGLEVAEPGTYAARFSDGTKQSTEVTNLPSPTMLTGPWQVEFRARAQQPLSIKMPILADWTTNEDERIKYFSGTANYVTTFELPSRSNPPGQRVWLDLGRVEVVADVSLNGHSLGVLWHLPYRLDVTDSLQPGINTLKITVANLWVNRLIGDEREPADTDYTPAGALRDMPQWLTAGTPRPTKRQTFAFWRHYRADDPLEPSGLLGPIQLQTTHRLPWPSQR
jgi:hypothetical protein